MKVRRPQMMLAPNEFSLAGRWLQQGGTVVGDATSTRIELLVAQHLDELRRTGDGWSTLFRDPNDGRLWEHTYAESHMHGGGPPSLRCISPSEAQAKYRYVA
jgi:hypothetical protein